MHEVYTIHEPFGGAGDARRPASGALPENFYNICNVNHNTRGFLRRRPRRGRRRLYGVPLADGALFFLFQSFLLHIHTTPNYLQTAI